MGDRTGPMGVRDRQRADSRGAHYDGRMVRFLTLLRSLPIEVEVLSFDGLSELASLAHEYELSAYDAAYLGVAVRRRIPLATRELPLREAARRSGAAVFGS